MHHLLFTVAWVLFTVCWRLKRKWSESCDTRDAFEARHRGVDMVRCLRSKGQGRRLCHAWLKTRIGVGTGERFHPNVFSRGPAIKSNLHTNNTVVATTIRLQLDCSSTARRPFDDLRYNRRLTFAWAIYCIEAWMNKEVSVTAVSESAAHVSHMTLMAFDK